MKTILIIAAILAVLGLGWYVMMPGAAPKETAIQNNMPAPGFSDNNVPEKEVLLSVEMSASGFSPSVIDIKKGTTVVFKNVDTVPHWPASSKHPTHLDYPGFDAKRGILPGEEYKFTFNEVKSIGVHDHLNPKLFGKITVTE